MIFGGVAPNIWKGLDQHTECFLPNFVFLALIVSKICMFIHTDRHELIDSVSDPEEEYICMYIVYGVSQCVHIEVQHSVAQSKYPFWLFSMVGG